MWFRNTWSWDVDAPRPEMRAVGDSVVGIDHPFVGPMELIAGPGPDGTLPAALFCENETNDQRLFGSAALTPYPKDGINDHVVGGAATVNPDRAGTKDHESHAAMLSEVSGPAQYAWEHDPRQRFDQRLADDLGTDAVAPQN